jgi:hypothetical protein
MVPDEKELSERKLLINILMLPTHGGRARAL